LWSQLAAHVIHGSAIGQGDQELPQVVAVLQFRKAIFLDTAKKSGKCFLRDVISVHNAAGHILELPIGSADQLLNVPLPDLA
jgi:hypothetical protein